MPFVAPADAPNARLTKIPLDPVDRDALHRVPLIASAAMRLVLLEMPGGYRTVPHRHPAAGELFIILTGGGRFTFDDGAPVAVAPGDLLYAHAGELHAIEAGPSGLRFLAGVGPNEDRPDEEIVDGEGAATPR
jgi:quercetin dioxygenase-like cupin family protein